VCSVDSSVVIFGIEASIFSSLLLGSLFFPGKFLTTVVHASGVETSVGVVQTVKSFSFESNGIGDVRSLTKWVHGLTVAGLSTSKT